MDERKSAFIKLVQVSLFSLKGIPKGSTVAVSTYMVSEHGNRKDQKEFFMKGYNEMLRQIQPERIICYNTPFPEMEGNIIFVDYELSSWKYQKEMVEFSPYAKYVCGLLPLPENSDIIIKSGYITQEKGMGHSHGGQWQPNPNKINDLIFQGEPNTVQRHFINKNKNGYWIEVEYDAEGWAISIKHETDHGNAQQHSNPHYHFPEYDPYTHAPIWKQFLLNHNPNIIQKFKDLEDTMSDINKYLDGIIIPYNEEALRFKTIAEFKDVINRGAEIVFEWNGIEYGAFGCFRDEKTGEQIMIIAQCGSAEVNAATEKICHTADEVLDYMVGNDRLRDVITKVIVCERTF